MKCLHELFEKCISADYIHISESADYFIEKEGETLYIYLQCSRGVEDWVNNFDFLPVPHKRIGGGMLFCHKGFLRVWRAVEPMVASYLLDGGIAKIITVGYSHGGALAALCHEYALTVRPDLIAGCFGYGFGAPRVFFGKKSRAIAEKCKNFTVIRNIDDVVTHLPPRLLGYYHPGKILEVGTRGKYTRFDAHRPENILAELNALKL